jgi:deoxycytidylate deaminase
MSTHNVHEKCFFSLDFPFACKPCLAFCVGRVCLAPHFVVVELNFFSDAPSLCYTFPYRQCKLTTSEIFFKMFSAEYPPSPTQSEADMDAMTAHVENRPYHEAFMREAINMVRLFPHRNITSSSECGQHWINANFYLSDQAELALASDETPVGCVFVHDGKVIAQGMNGTNVTMNVSKQNPTPAITLSTRLDYLDSHSTTPLTLMQLLSRVCNHCLTCSLTGNPPCRICGPQPDSGQTPTFNPPGNRPVRHCRAVHHVCFCLAPIPHPRRLLWLPQRSLRWLWWCHAYL